MTSPDYVSPNYVSRDYIDVQLRFAGRVAEVSGKPLADAVLYYTNFHRRMGLGVAGPGERAPAWRKLMAGFDALSHEARLSRLVDTLGAAGDGSAILLPGRYGFGCFACEAPNADGMVRIHFGNREGRQDVGPLHHTRIAVRRAELAGMFGWLAREHPAARRVDGGSWLYNLEAYRRLFPAEFGASRDPRNGPPYLHGMSTWGQFIDFRGRIRVDVRDAFLASLPALDMAAPHRVFPYQVQFTTAPFEAFRREYGV